jgi:hypothetical protein
MRSAFDWRRWRLGRTGPIEFLALAGLGLFLASVGAFGTGEAPAAIRFIYWVTVMVGGGLIGAVIEPLLLRWPAMTQRPRLFAAVQTVVMTFPITLLVWSVSSIMLAGGRMTLLELVFLWPSVLIVDIAVVILAWLIRRSTQPKTEVRRQGAPPPAIAGKLPPRLARAELMALEAEDHYLRVHTSAGDALILMRFSDALEAVADADGLQSHRSWWVAKQAVEDAAFRDGRGELTLRCGVKAPVSRSYAEAVRRTDWT